MWASDQPVTQSRSYNHSRHHSPALAIYLLASHPPRGCDHRSTISNVCSSSRDLWARWTVHGSPPWDFDWVPTWSKYFEGDAPKRGWCRSKTHRMSPVCISCWPQKYILDTSSYPTKYLVDPGLAEHQGPALLVYNDAVFSEDDFTSLKRLGDSVKMQKKLATGKFGLGFNSVSSLFRWY